MGVTASDDIEMTRFHGVEHHLAPHPPLPPLLDGEKEDGSC